ncbi:hypothetical protein QP178_17405 [Sphingomonas aurantiaca]|uniref:hypothetical protein n=1 Tax=Sphingomonas aurantiaca TaxID=185949 RepID=UPI002FE406D6
MTSTMPAPVETSYGHAVLDLKQYWTAIAEELPLPTFAQINNAGLPDRRAVKFLGSDKQADILNSPLSSTFYEAAQGVDQLIVEDIRRRAALDV